MGRGRFVVFSVIMVVLLVYLYAKAWGKPPTLPPIPFSGDAPGVGWFLGLPLIAFVPFAIPLGSKVEEMIKKRLGPKVEKMIKNLWEPYRGFLTSYPNLKTAIELIGFCIAVIALVCMGVQAYAQLVVALSAPK
jgi:hypothetical protein